MDYSTLAARIAKLNLSRLAEVAGVDRRTLQRIAKGEVSPTLKTCNKIEAGIKALRTRPKAA